EQQACAAGRRAPVDRRTARVSGAGSDTGCQSRAGARRVDPGSGHPHDGAAGSRRVVRVGEAARCERGSRDRQRIRVLAASALRSVRGRAESPVSSAKPVNQRAWWFVLPVLISVAFSALIPLMTIVNYSVQDILGPDQAVFVGMEWYQEILRDPDLHGALY